MTEYEVIKQIKEEVNVKANKEYLYKKYIFLFKKNAYLLSKYMKTSMYFDDFINESYFVLDYVINWVDIEKINNPSTFSIALLLKQRIQNMVHKFIYNHNKNIGTGSLICEDGKEKFISHEIISLLEYENHGAFDIVEDSIALNYRNPAHSDIIHKVIKNYIYNHNEVMKHPLQLEIIENGLRRIMTEKPMKKWQLKYFELLLQGVPVNEINCMREVVAAKQEWYRTRNYFWIFIKERINRAIDINLISV